MNRKIGIIAGDGELPNLLIDSLLKEGIVPYVVALNYKVAYYSFCKSLDFIKVSIGEVSKAISFFKKNAIEELIFIGRVLRPSFSLFFPDPEAKVLLENIKKNLGGDNNLFLQIIDFFENRHGFKVISARDFLRDYLLFEDIRSKNIDKYQEDIDIGVNFIKENSKYDIGQAVVVRDRQIIAVEALEGTDLMLQRLIKLNKCHDYGGSLIKMPKKGQNIKIDIPTIGLKTLKIAHKAKLCNIAIAKGCCFIVGKDNIINFIEDKGINLVVI